jgi:hypothetical protein
VQMIYHPPLSKGKLQNKVWNVRKD